MLDRAISFAAQMHEGQFDKSEKPYILHPLAVMHMLQTDDVELQCIAVLHDVIEDTDATLADLFNLSMSARVLDAVDRLTKFKGQSYEDYKEVVFSSRDAMRVKLCDLRHNSDLTRLKSVREKDLTRVAKYAKFYSEIKERLNA
jgi:(p)ppGpp synthase/HD superfamily hydrolase